MADRERMIALPQAAWNILALLALDFLAAAGSFVLVVLQGRGTGAALLAMAATALTGLVVAAVVRLGARLREQGVVRTRLAQAAVRRERIRFARDLHDLLGHNLSVVILRSELALRLVDANPAHARRELEHTIGLLRQASADVRAIADGCRELSLEAEVAAAQSVLRAAGIECATRIEVGELPAPMSDVLAWAVREAVTNVLNHSRAKRLEIVVTPRNGGIRLTILNDGAPPAAGRPARDRRLGTGLRNLSERAAAVGGWTSAGRGPGGQFQLVVEVPE